MTTNLRVRTVPRLCELNPGICLTTEKKARKNLSQGSQRMLFPITNTPTQLQYPPNTHPHYYLIIILLFGGVFFSK